MNRYATHALLPALLLAVAASAAVAQDAGKRLYRWVDRSGQVHYGDSIPPEYASQHRDVLNQQGVMIGRQDGSLSGAESEAQDAAQKAVREAAQQRQRDRILLQTYQTTAEIEALRNRRLELIDAQLQLQEQSMHRLRLKRKEQEQHAARFQPVNRDPRAQPLPEGLKADLEQSANDIATQESNLQRKRQERDNVFKRFEADLNRFKELRGS